MLMDHLLFAECQPEALAEQQRVWEERGPWFSTRVAGVFRDLIPERYYEYALSRFIPSSHTSAAGSSPTAYWTLTNTQSCWVRSASGQARTACGGTSSTSSVPRPCCSAATTPASSAPADRRPGSPCPSRPPAAGRRSRPAGRPRPVPFRAWPGVSSRARGACVRALDRRLSNAFLPAGVTAAAWCSPLAMSRPRKTSKSPVSITYRLLHAAYVRPCQGTELPHPCCGELFRLG